MIIEKIRRHFRDECNLSENDTGEVAVRGGRGGLVLGRACWRLRRTPRDEREGGSRQGRRIIPLIRDLRFAICDSRATAASLDAEQPAPF